MALHAALVTISNASTQKNQLFRVASYEFNIPSSVG